MRRASLEFVLATFLALTSMAHETPRFVITDFGATTNGAPCTRAFEKAIAACGGANGGQVIVPAGTWFTGPIHLKSGVTLCLECGATLSFSDNPADYLPAVPSSWEGLECLNYSPLIYAYGCTNVAIVGKGSICPRMAYWRKLMKESGTDIQGARAILYKWGSEDFPIRLRDITKAHPAIMRPQCIQFNRCKGVLMDGVSVGDSPFWTIHLFLSEDVTLRHLDVRAHGFNNDGVDIEMSRNVLIEDSTFDQGDDGFVFKAGRNRDGWRIGRPTENVEIRNCKLKNAGSLVGIGSELSGGIRHVFLHDCTIEAACNLFYVKTNRRRGGFVDDIRMANVHCGVAAQVFAVDTDVLYQWRQFPDYELRPTAISNLHMENVVCDRAQTGLHVNGDSQSPVQGLTVRNVRIGTLQHFLSRVQHAEGVVTNDFTFGAKAKVVTPWSAEYDPVSNLQP